MNIQHKLIRQNAAQYINGRAFLHLYECAKCGDMVVKRQVPECSSSCRKCRSIVHGDARLPLYAVWKNMRQRCVNSNNKSYKNYGAKGVRVCCEWDSYESFRQWAVSSGWSKGLEIDRVDPSGDYCPSNCRVVTPQENRRRTSRVKLSVEKARRIREMAESGVRRREIAREFGVDVSVVYDVIRGRLWSDGQRT